ncbi:MAG: (Fe-S)-binding protein [Desulfococcaceae bacterium]
MSRTTLQNCGRCGLCLSACPVYKVLKEEHASPRARLKLIQAYKNKTLPTSPVLQELVSKCLMCGRCAAMCPSGINHYGKFMEMRREMAAAHGDKIEIRSLVFMLAREYRLRAAAGVARIGRGLLPASFQKKSRLGNIPLDRFPELPKTALRESLPEEIPPKATERGTVVYFTGCATNHLFADTGHAAVRVLTAMGYRVRIPEDQTCCALPMLFHGAADQAGNSIQANIQALETAGDDPILVDCATCGTALKKEYPLLCDTLHLDPQAVAGIAARVFHITPFVLDHLDELDFPRTNTALKVTSHTPCHRKHGFGGEDVVARLLKKLPGVDYRPAPDAEECCGGGGTFFYEYPEISKKMVDKKVASAQATGADIWVTDCPVCRINLAGNLKGETPMRVIHPLELIDMQLGRS